MATEIRTLLADMFTDTVTAHPVTGQDGYGNLTTSGSFTISCRISEKNRLVRDATGQEVVSSFKVICNEVNGLAVPRSTASGMEGHLFTLPSSESPRTLIEPISVARPRDENNVHHEVIYFP